MNTRLQGQGARVGVSEEPNLTNLQFCIGKVNTANTMVSMGTGAIHQHIESSQSPVRFSVIAGERHPGAVLHLRTQNCR